MNTFYVLPNVIAKLYLYYPQSYGKFSFREINSKRKVERGAFARACNKSIRTYTYIYITKARASVGERINKFLSDEAVKYGIKLNSIRGNAD